RDPADAVNAGRIRDVGGPIARYGGTQMKHPARFSMLFTFMALAGCAHHKPPPPEPAMAAYGCPMALSRVYTMHDLIAAKVQTAGHVPNISVQDMRCRIQDNQLLRIDFTVANSASIVRRIAYRFDWIDRNGMKAWSDESWKPLYLYEYSH